MILTEETTVEDIIWGGGGAKSAEWPHVGAWVGGPIQARPKKYQPTEYVKGAPAGSGRPRTTRDGRPVWGIRVDVQTTLRDPAVENDNGIRRMHLDKWRQHDALRDALAEAGVRHLEPGGELWIQWTGETSDGDGSQPAKTWAAKYRPPADSAAGIVAPPVAAVPPVPVAVPAVPGWSAPPAGAPQGPQNPAPVAQPAAAPPVPPAPPTAPMVSGSPGMTTASYSAPPVAATPATPPAQPLGVQNVITESVAAALRAQGVDTSAFHVVPG